MRSEVFKGCGHFIPDEQPDRLARDLQTFIAEDHPDPDGAEVGPVGDRIEALARAHDQITVPPAFVKVAPPAVAPAAPTAEMSAAPERLEGAVLVVEDNMIIALEAEEVLTALGASAVDTASTTREALRLIDASPPSRALLDVNLGSETVAKWRNRTSVTDQRTGPKDPRSTVMSPEDEVVVVAFRRHTLLPLDDGLYALQATIPHLTRSSLHRCLQRHGIRRLPEVDGDKPKRSRFKAYPLGYLNIDLAEVHTAEGRLYLLIAIDRTTKFAFVELHEKATRRVVGDFLRHFIEAVPYTVHTVLTDDDTHFTTPGNGASAAPLIKEAIAAGETFRAHSFESACARNDIDHRLIAAVRGDNA